MTQCQLTLCQVYDKLYIMSNNQTKTRTRILEATWQLMEEKQGRGVRMSDIAKAAGITRQALYLHFASRTDLLVATTRYIDEARGLEKRLIPWRSAVSGVEMIDAFVEFWANYIPEIYGLAKALLAVYDADEAAAEAWHDRMDAIKNGCQRMVERLVEEGRLTAELSKSEAVSLFSTLLSVRNWEQLTVDNGWSNKQYINHMQTTLKRTLVQEAKA